MPPTKESSKPPITPAAPCAAWTAPPPPSPKTRNRCSLAMAPSPPAPANQALPLAAPRLKRPSSFPHPESARRQPQLPRRLLRRTAAPTAATPTRRRRHPRPRPRRQRHHLLYAGTVRHPDGGPHHPDPARRITPSDIYETSLFGVFVQRTEEQKNADILPPPVGEGWWGQQT